MSRGLPELALLRVRPGSVFLGGAAAAAVRRSPGAGRSSRGPSGILRSLRLRALSVPGRRAGSSLRGGQQTGY